MKVLTLHQPWATLLVLGIKTVETRSWQTHYRGKVLIHSSKKPIDYVGMKRNNPAMLAMINDLLLSQRFPLGCIVGSVNIRYVIDSQKWLAESEAMGFDEAVKRESILGDLSPNRFAWSVDEPVIFVKPIPCKGALNLWNLPEELELNLQGLLKL